jgi:hypothetical protein
MQKQTGAQEILKEESAKFLKKKVKIENIISTLIELVRIAYDEEWMIDYHKKSKTTTKGANKKQKGHKKNLAKLSDSRLLVRRVEIPKLKLKGKVTNLLKQSTVVQNLWLRYSNKAINNRIVQIKAYIKKLDEKIKTTAGSTSGKKRYATRVKKAKSLLKAYSQLISGGNFFGRVFLGKKDLARVTAQAVKQKFPGIRLHPDELVTNPKKNTIFGKKVVLNIPPMIGTYQRLTEVYAATWVKGSEFVRKLKDEIIWRILEKSSKKNFPLERKIIENLHSEARRGGKVDQETIVRTTIEQEVSLIFNNAVRTAIAYTFSSIKNDLLVRLDKRTKDFYIPIGIVNISKNLLPNDYEKIKYAKLSKISDDQTEIRLNLSEILPEMSSRRKKSHSVRVFLRDGLMEYLRNNFFKAFNYLGEQTEKYIGEQAADLFFSHSRMLERLILEAIDES